MPADVERARPSPMRRPTDPRRRELVLAKLFRDRLAKRERRPPVPLAEQVHGGPVQVPGRLRHASHAVPSLPYLQERVLREFLRLRTVARDQAEMCVQASASDPGRSPRRPPRGPHDGFARACLSGDRRIDHHATFNPWRGRNVEVPRLAFGLPQRPILRAVDQQLGEGAVSG